MPTCQNIHGVHQGSRGHLVTGSAISHARPQIKTTTPTHSLLLRLWNYLWCETNRPHYIAIHLIYPRLENLAARRFCSINQNRDDAHESRGCAGLSSGLQCLRQHLQQQPKIKQRWAAHGRRKQSYNRPATAPGCERRGCGKGACVDDETSWTAHGGVYTTARVLALSIL